MKDCIYQTDPEWAGFLRENAIKQEVNFWRKDRRVMGLEPGAYFYFKKRGSSSMIGRGRLVRSELRTVEEAWNVYQKGNGASSLEHLKPQIASVLNIDLNKTLDAEIRCMILEDLEWLADEDVYELSEEQFPKNILAMKYFDRGEDFHDMESLFESKNQQSSDQEIQEGTVNSALDVAEQNYAKSRGQSFSASPKRKRAVELQAMSKAKSFLEMEGYQCQDTSANRPYDIEVRKDGQVLYVEVKGTTAGGEYVFVTKNEVEHARSHSDSSMLFVLHDIEIDYSDPESPKAGGGVEKVIHPWIPEQSHLTSLSYRYEVDSDT